MDRAFRKGFGLLPRDLQGTSPHHLRDLLVKGVQRQWISRKGTGSAETA